VAAIGEGGGGRGEGRGETGQRGDLGAEVVML